ncbi:MAG: tRNA (N6-threonylcarbamoyladenosine(37)-N6)-methyltransferase TrmO [Lentisphaerae bacterium RIFOXYB12_FULL_65_16]|nr:MAG: tRNA (N6-threonylcarbamoyladenosine(37)-N6)-methyltransferase TrmO [Lentisphaerae bacterium RIFOXYA12_64_32]OGV87447.1 MAG: tRNA (N6-threonylcarbamoyladenosine(37)-N6)-methyltransferase TrmO [Lentisphaerae bacterium RIFOXYB12_FULL_65_16]
MQIRPIGIISTPFKEPKGTPIQPVFAEEDHGTAEVLPEYSDALADLAGFERVWLIYWFDRVGPVQLRVTPFRDTVAHGLFATRVPCRPNPIGLSCVRLREVRGNTLVFSGADMLDGTPLLDIKPYVPGFDAFPGIRAGWFDKPGTDRTHADGRFAGQGAGAPVATE